jgi:exoribonuclease R
MVLHVVRVKDSPPTWYTESLRALESELEVPDAFPADVDATAKSAARRPRLADLDRTDIPLVTLDPAGSMDLDQAFHIERREHGLRVYYAIADVAAFVEPDGLVDQEAHRRRETLYAPDRKVPLYPTVLSEGAASLLPGEIRPALLWTIDLDPAGEETKVDVRRARVRSTAKLDYESVQAEADAGRSGQRLELLAEVGKLRLAREADRGGVSLPLPEQIVSVDGEPWQLEYRAQRPVEIWNAQLSLLTGMCAAQLMLYGEVGILRTLPPPDERAVTSLRRRAQALGFVWEKNVAYPDFVRALDPETPAGAAMLTACTSLLRGASYVAFDGGVPEYVDHAALAAEYAHVTAPLRRLADRYAEEVCVALCADAAIPDWVHTKLKALPAEMDAGDLRAHRYQAELINLVEAGLLHGHVGDTFHGVVTARDNDDARKGSIMIASPAIEARVSGPEALPLGRSVAVTLVGADPVARQVHFAVAGDRLR